MHRLSGQVECMLTHLVADRCSSSQQVLHCVQVVAFTGCHQWCSLLLIKHVQIGSSLCAHI